MSYHHPDEPRSASPIQQWTFWACAMIGVGVWFLAIVGAGYLLGALP